MRWGSQPSPGLGLPPLQEIVGGGGLALSQSTVMASQEGGSASLQGFSGVAGSAPNHGGIQGHF